MCSYSVSSKKLTDNVYKCFFSIDSILFPDWDANINEITLTERTSAQGPRWCFKRRSVLFLVTSLGGDLFIYIYTYFFFFGGGVNLKHLQKTIFFDTPVKNNTIKTEVRQYRIEKTHERRDILWNINMEPENHPFEKEIRKSSILQTPSFFWFRVFIFRGTRLT